MNIHICRVYVLVLILAPIAQLVPCDKTRFIIFKPGRNFGLYGRLWCKKREREKQRSRNLNLNCANIHYCRCICMYVRLEGKYLFWYFVLILQSTLLIYHFYNFIMFRWAVRLVHHFESVHSANNSLKSFVGLTLSYRFLKIYVHMPIFLSCK